MLLHVVAPMLGLVVVEVRMERPPPTRGLLRTGETGVLRGVPVGVRQRGPVVLAGGVRLDEQSIAFFEAATGHLLAAEERAGVRHHVAVSIVGCDRVDLGYYFGKRRPEELVRSGPVPKMLSQPVAARELAGLLVEVALGDPIGLAPDVDGPEQHLISDLARRLVAHCGQRTKVVAVPLPGKVGRQVADGGLLTGEGATILPMTYDEWLAAR